MSTLIACPDCGARRWTVFHRLAATPVTCTSIFDSAAQAQAVPDGRIELGVCGGCGFISNLAFDRQGAEVGARYESSQAASATFSRFADRLAEEWVSRHGLRGGTVLEIGSAEGGFLRLLLRHGVASGIGVDPLAPPGDAGPGLRFIASAFESITHDIPADALVCRHTLEHVADVGRFLEAVARWAARDARRVVLFELPDVRRVLEEGAFWDVYHEHCSYFTDATLRGAFVRAGLEVSSQDVVYGGQYLLIEGRASCRPRPSVSDEAVAGQTLALCNAFGMRVAQGVQRCTRSLSRMQAEGRPMVLWQGAAKTVGFLAALPTGLRPAAAVDLNAARHGRYLPGSALPVIAPGELSSLRPAHVVLMNSVYREEVAQRLADVSPGARLWTVDELVEGRGP